MKWCMAALSMLLLTGCMGSDSVFYVRTDAYQKCVSTALKACIDKDGHYLGASCSDSAINICKQQYPNG